MIRSLARFLLKDTSRAPEVLEEAKALWLSSPLFKETDEELPRWLTLNQSRFEVMVGMDQLAGQQLMVFVVCGLLADLGEDWKSFADAKRLAEALKASGCSDYVRICGEAWLPWPDD